MAGIEKDFGFIPPYKGPFVRTTIEVPREQIKKGAKKTRTVIIVDTNTPISQLTNKNK